MNYEEKIRELTERIQVLEKAEGKRIAKKRMTIIAKVVEIIVILIVLFMVYTYINNNYIKPYKEKIDYINEKIDNVEAFINDKFGGLQKYFK